MKITKVWAMPDKGTFKILPIKKLLGKYVRNGRNWIDPFAGENSPVGWTNDLNPKNRKADFHLDAKEFVEKLNGKKFDGVLFDPPYSLRQIKECYDSVGKKLFIEESQDASFGKVKDLITPKINAGGIAISCGWNSNGFGKQRGFKTIEILLVAHGGHHNDTIVVVEQKFQNEIFEETLPS